MQRISFFMLAAVLAVSLAACQPQALEERVPDVDGEILFDSVVGQPIPADEASFFGISLGDTEEEIIGLHGEPDIDRSQQFGRVRHMEYTFGTNTTLALYTVERGTVRSVLVADPAADLIAPDNLLDGSREDMFGMLGTPTVTQPLHLQTLYAYDELGYEVFTVRGEVDRIFFTAPNRGLRSPGRSTNATCDPAVTPAVEDATGQCIPFPNPCIVPEGWTVVDSCEDANADTAPTDANDSTNRPPTVCIQVITPAQDPDTGECREFPTPCDVPAGWDRVDSC